MRYIAFIHKDEDSVYGVSFPDFPGCISGGDTLDEAVVNASEALQGHVQMMEADGEEVPVARSMEEIMRNPDLADRTGNGDFDSSPADPRSGLTPHRINVSLDLALLKGIDEVASSRMQTPSAVLSLRCPAGSRGITDACIGNCTTACQ